jgi:predicted DNA binding CopG/RHH family protein
MNKARNKIQVPKFKNENEERKFWGKFDLAKHAGRKDFVEAHFPNLMPSSHPVSIRIPEHLMVRIKARANELQIPYQSLIKQYIADAMK